jgi:hypothetical protein
MPYAWVEDNGDVRARAVTVPEARIAIEELRLEKMDRIASKQAVTSQIAFIRADYRSEGGPVGGTVGRFARHLQSASRDSRRASVYEIIRPLEQRITGLDTALTNIDSGILELERYVLENK